MSARQPSQVTNLDRYGNAALEWRRALDQLGSDAAASPDTPYFLGTTRPDGRPHSVGIGALWHDGVPTFVRVLFIVLVGVVIGLAVHGLVGLGGNDIHTALDQWVSCSAELS